MIGRVLKRDSRVYGVLWYLYGPGKEKCAHSDPHLVSGWRHPRRARAAAAGQRETGFP